ncbi:MAG: cytochrome c oxidase subunit III [Cytophagaceae bacterium]|nr:MAG: cytochrome c oxidase subunit III [Cytophagaceae bacterium]
MATEKPVRIFTRRASFLLKTPDNERRNQVGAGRQPAGSSAFGRMERVPPLLLMFYLALAGIAMLFTVLVAMYVFTRLKDGGEPSGHPFPRYFSLSTIVLLVSAYILGQAQRLYRADDLANLARCLVATLLLGSIFCGLQLAGWRELKLQGVLFQDAPAGTYVYLISGVHIAHIVGGMLYLLVLLLRTLHAKRDDVRTLVFIRNPYHRRQLQAITVYWHFVDAIWLVLFAVFLFMY